MDNTSLDVFRKILKEVADIRTIVTARLATPSQKHNNSEEEHNRADNKNEDSNGEITQTTPRSKPKPTITKTQSAKQEKADSHPWLKQHAVELVGVAILFGYTTLTYLQWQAAAETLRDSERPILSLDWPNPVMFGWVTTPGQEPDASLHFRNKGKGSAQNATVETWLIFWGDSVMVKPATSAVTPSDNIGASEAFVRMIALTEEEKGRLRSNGTQPLVLYGRIKYQNVSDSIAGGTWLSGLLNRPTTYCNTFCMGISGQAAASCGGHQNLCDGEAHGLHFDRPPTAK